MHLKKLTLSGFKSFADTTHLEFGAGITAVVGPNGSGKSNIVDALLWALGERSHKALRGHQATDVIFNGSGGRKPTNLAEVHLHFDNEDKQLPINFADVQVTRRLFRDGDGEYAICGSKCRLKDVLDLFLDTGVGPDAYCIISQGEIDAILSAKPEDRRGLIEGAAGVQKYHARRTETRRKLDRVEVDLTRVADIMSELDGQLGPLARQAELAREYENYANRLRQLQLAVLARDYDVRVKRLVGLQEAKAQYTETVTKGRAEIETGELVEGVTEKRLRELEVQVDTLSRELTELISRQKATEGQIAVSRERRRALTEQQEFQAKEVGMLRACVTTAQENLAKARKELQEAQRSGNELSAAAAEAEAKLGNANARLAEATRAQHSLQAQVMDLMRAGQKKREALAGGRAETAGLENRLLDLKKLLEDLAAESANAAAGLEKARAGLAEIKSALAEAETRVREKREAWQGALVAQKASGEAGNATREKRARAQSRLSALRELEQNLEGLQGGTRSVLQAVNRGQLPDHYLPIADAIKVPAELELAIEVALGGNVNNLICPTDTDAKTAVEWLKRNQAGRATFLPLNSMRPSGLNDRTLEMLRQKSVRGVASELVECAPEHRKAVDHLLARFIVVETLDDAIQLARRCETGARLVTLEGEVVLPAGAITGGQGKQKTAGLLARKREIGELDVVVDELEATIAKEAENARAAAARSELEQENWRKAGEAAGEVRNSIARQEREIEHLEREVRRIKNQADAVESQRKVAQNSLDGKAARQEENAKAAEEAEERGRQLEAAAAAAQTVVAQRQAEREAVTEEVSDVRAGYSATQERLSAMKRSLTEQERFIHESESQIRQKQAQIDRAAGEAGRIVAEESALVSTLAEVTGRREAQEANLNAARTERGAALEKLQATQIALREARIRVHDAEDELHRVEVRLAATETEMADMERRFREEFELGVEEALTHRDDIEVKGAALDEIDRLTANLSALGSVNLGAVSQYEQVKERLDFLTEQRADLETSRAELDAIILEIDGRMREQFLTTFAQIQIAFEEMFTRTFGGGKTHLALTHPENLLETGIDLRVQMPGKASQDIGLLSGGERALTALSFMLALLRVRPSPFVVLDEVDAPLDQSNVTRFTDLLREFSGTTQFIVITHNNGTMQAADVLYGVTQQEPGISTLMSVKLVAEEEIVASRNGRRRAEAEVG